MAEHNVSERTTPEADVITKETQLSGQKRPNEDAPIPGKHLLESLKKHKTDVETTTEPKEIAPETSKEEETTTPSEEMNKTAKKENGEKKEEPTEKEIPKTQPSSLETKVHGDALLQKHLETSVGTGEKKQEKEVNKEKEKEEKPTTKKPETSVASQ